MLFRLVGDVFAPAGDGAKLCILIYHRALPAPDILLSGEVDAATFESHMKLLASEFRVLPLSEACERLVQGELPARAACITFDDGYADNEQVALGILRRLNLQATFFVSTGYSNGGAMFNDIVIEAVRCARSGTHDLSALGLGIHKLEDNTSRRAALDALIMQLKYRPVCVRKDLAERVAEKLGVAVPANLMLSPRQIRRLHSEGMEIGGHTVNHPILAKLSEDEARAEIVDNKRRLEEITGAPVRLFAYPNGKPGQDYGPQHVRLVKEAGFAAAVSTVRGAAHRTSDLFQLPRFTPWDKTPLRFGMRLLLTRARPAVA